MWSKCQGGPVGQTVVARVVTRTQQRLAQHVVLPATGDVADAPSSVVLSRLFIVPTLRMIIPS